MAAVNDTVGILAKRVEELSRRLAQYRGITDVEAEIASKRAAYAAQHNEKVGKLKQKINEAKTAIRQEYEQARLTQEKAIEQGKAIINRAREHAERIKREAGEEVFREYEKLGDERAALATEKRRIQEEARMRADALLAEARAKAEGIVAEARAKADAMLADAQVTPEGPTETTPQPQTATLLPSRERPKKKKGRRR